MLSNENQGFVGINVFTRLFLASTCCVLSHCLILNNYFISSVSVTSTVRLFDPCLALCEFGSVVYRLLLFFDWGSQESD